jgi:hypothetical protein
MMLALWEKWGEALKIRRDAYTRMLGEREAIEKITQTWEKPVIDRTSQISEWLPIVRHFLAQEQEVNMYFNN